MQVKVTLEMQSYIAHPYWPARDVCINIEKKSGVNRLKNEEKRMAALKAECKKHDLTYDRYLELKQEAAEHWYRRKEGTIYIPRHQLAGALVETIGKNPKALCGMFTKDNFRALVRIADFQTEITEAAGVFGRFVKLDGSNQRSWQENEYIGWNLDEGEPFEATGLIGISDPRQEDTVRGLVTTAVETIGVGAARKMGFGRGKVKSWQKT